MNLARRVEELEHRSGVDQDCLVLVLSFSGCDPEKLGLERAIRRKVVAYKETSGNREWRVEAGQSEQEVKEEIEQEARAEGARIKVVCECYEGEE